MMTLYLALSPNDYIPFDSICQGLEQVRADVGAHLQKLIHAFISCRLDSCNALLSGLPRKIIRELQLVENAASKTRTRKTELITPVLRSLHWLPVTYRMDFKVLLLVYKSINIMDYMNINIVDLLCFFFIIFNIPVKINLSS